MQARFIDTPIGAIPKEFEKQDIGNLSVCDAQGSNCCSLAELLSETLPGISIEDKSSELDQGEWMSRPVVREFLANLEMECGDPGREFIGHRSYYYQDEMNVIYALAASDSNDAPEDVMFENALQSLDIVLSKVSPVNKQFIVFSAAGTFPAAIALRDKLVRARRKELISRGVTVSAIPIESVLIGKPVFSVSGAYYQPRKPHTEWYWHDDFIPIPSYLRRWMENSIGDAMDESIDLDLILPAMLQLFKTGAAAMYPTNDTRENLAKRILARLVGECISFRTLRKGIGYPGSFLYAKNFSETVVKLLLRSDEVKYREVFEEWLRDISISPQEIMQRIEEIESARQNDTMIGEMLERLGNVDVSLLACLADIKALQMLDEDKLDVAGMNPYRARKMIEKLARMGSVIEQAITGVETVSARLDRRNAE